MINRRALFTVLAGAAIAQSQPAKPAEALIVSIDTRAIKEAVAQATAAVRKEFPVMLHEAQARYG